jgi:uroporphyrin-III C-methyltransferase
MAERGSVALVGAGPGDPELITVKALARLRSADVVVHDRLVPRALLDEAPATARRIDVGKAPGRQPWPQPRINRLLVAEARRGRRVVRLKGGDPFVFGRGGEECQALAAAGVPCEVVPGVTSAVAVPGRAGIPVTHRGCATSFAVVTGHTAGIDPCALPWTALAQLDTVVVLMGLGQLRAIASQLIAAGRPAATPAAVISAGTTPHERVVCGSLGDIADRASGMPSPATIVVGDTVGLFAASAGAGRERPARLAAVGGTRRG